MSKEDKNENPSFNLTKETPLRRVLLHSGDCKKCGHCCSFSSCFFLSDDIDKAAENMGLSRDHFIERYLEEHTIYNTKVHRAKTLKEKGKPYGNCIFLDENKECSIHDFKPLHCRVGNGCSPHGEELSIWFALNYLVCPQDPQSVREWGVYLRTHPSIPGGELHNLVPDKAELAKILSYDKLK